MEKTAPTKLKQIRVATGHLDFESDANSLATKVALAKEHELLRANLISKCPARLWSKGSYRAVCPRPILVAKYHQQRVIELSEALTIAVNDIVERWWSDPQARFFERMPLKQEEEDLLKRPDFLIENRADGQDEAAGESFLIMEINGRFSFNGTIHLAYGQEALDDMNLGGFKLASTTASSQVFDGLQSLFNTNMPVHLLIGEEAGMDIHMLIDAAKERFGIIPRLINPSDLRLEPDLQVHDKRMLGIVKQELPGLVRAEVLTPDQARALDEGIVDTFIPGTPQLHSLLQKSLSSPTLKDEYILKPIRGGKGAGIVFGDHLTPHEWNTVLGGGLQSQAAFVEGTYVVQRKVKHCLYDLVLHESGEKLHYPLVGTWHVMHGKFCGLGTWCSSGGRICAISSGGSIICSVSKIFSGGVDTTLRNKLDDEYC
ncbi:hypothetical protein E0Z10_g7803 [Xylaria hypoxylon]|uniref:Uncharacterized protein n=1 Tax=Xylaria hypoxylon TaxID=37992 RepID=A0A4Z0YCX8_9PEZI|nr:hypothetical protein E0Z10_g7803 [Xylaria hypoxylon]